MNKPSPLGNLSKLSDVAKMVVKPAQKADEIMKLDRIYTMPQVRTIFRGLEKLAASFKENGIIEPLVVHEEPDGRHRLIIGERRFRAAPLADLDEAPVVIKRGLTEEQIRALQVAENEEREDLTPYERAMGVIQDVEKFGTKAAMKIWNVTSEGWISKRVAVKRYLPITLSILQNELSGDLEILHTINKIEHIDPAVAAEYREQLEREEPLHRDSVRGRLNMMELQRKEQEEQLERQAASPAPAAETSAASSPAAGGQVVPPEEARTDAIPAPSAKQGQKASVTQLKAPHKAKPAVDAEAAAAREKTQKGERLYALREELFDYGRDNESSFKELQALMFDLGQSAQEGEWILWTGFLDMVLPMLERLGPDRARAYLKRLQVDLKGRSPAALWTELHPDSTIDNLASRGTPVAPMPPGWKF